MHYEADSAGELTGASKEMPRYVSHKTVWALEITSVEAPAETPAGGKVSHFIVSFRESGYAPRVLPVEMFSRYMPIPGDFYVVYVDGYKSFSPRKAFLEGYTKVSSRVGQAPQD